VLADLHGGESYAYAPPAAARAESKPVRQPAHSAKASSARADAGMLIERARGQLSSRQISNARASIDAALALSPEPRLRAEALTLRAECALVDGDQGAAVEAYLRVARTFAALPAGENALYAAARLEADRQRSAAAAQLLERYLERYPQGRFEREARTRLHALSAALDHAQ
jgi:outer membrane protein assembly factor BamD (BamD/ComL family)